jgi:hypothetical protein
VDAMTGLLLVLMFVDHLRSCCNLCCRNVTGQENQLTELSAEVAALW